MYISYNTKDQNCRRLHYYILFSTTMPYSLLQRWCFSLQWLSLELLGGRLCSLLFSFSVDTWLPNTFLCFCTQKVINGSEIFFRSFGGFKADFQLFECISFIIKQKCAARYRSINMKDAITVQRITLIIPPKERERQCLLLNGVRESAEGVCKGCFSNCTQNQNTCQSWVVSTSVLFHFKMGRGTCGTCLMSFFFLADSGMLLTCWYSSLRAFSV